MIIIFKSLCFIQLNKDLNILMRKFKEEITLISIYINDFLYVFNNTDMFEIIKKKLRNKYNSKDLGEVEIIIDWQITYNLSTQTL